MIVRRIALFFALLFGLAMTQVPEFIQQYRQALGGAVGELEGVVAAYNANSARQGLTEAGGLDRRRSNADPIVRDDAAAMEQTIDRLKSLREAQVQFRNEGGTMRLATFVTHFDGRVAGTAFRDFYPAVPVSIEAFVLGAIGFLLGGGVAHYAGRPLRRRRSVRPVETVA